MTAEIRTDISPDIHPGALAPFNDALNIDGTMGRGVLNDGITTLTEVYTTIGNINDALEAYRVVAPKQTRVVGGRATEVALPNPDLLSAAHRAFDRTAAMVDRKTAALNKSAETMEARITEALSDVYARTPLGAEIRGHVKSLPAEKRFEFASDLASAGKKGDIAAILVAPGYLSGLSDEAHANLRLLAADKFAPVDHRQLTATRKVIERVERAGSALFNTYTKVIETSRAPSPGRTTPSGTSGSAMFGLSKKQQRQMLSEQFFHFLEEAGEPFQVVINEAMSAPNITLEEVAGLADKHSVDRRVVLALYGYLPDDGGHFVNVNHPANIFKRVHIEGREHLAAWTLFTGMMWERKGNWSPYVLLGPQR